MKLDRLCAEHFLHRDFIGIDMEWCSRAGSKVALMQLSTNDVCVLVQLTHLQRFPQNFKRLLECDTIKKVGLNVAGDITRFRNSFEGATINGAVELTDEYGDFQLENKSLAYLVKRFLRQELLKPLNIVRSNWEDEVLTEHQQEYAATDAYACYRLIDLLMEVRDGTATFLPPPNSVDHDSNAAKTIQRILLDAFHLMNRYTVSKQHPLFAEFMVYLRMAIFIESDEDLQKALGVLGQKGINDRLPRKQLISKGRIRRLIPEAAIVARRVDMVVQYFRQADPTFITDAILKIHANVMKHLQLGCLSDFPGVPLYTTYSAGNQTKFARLKCARGTSQQEGFHRYVYYSIAAVTASPHVIDPILLDLVNRWNIDRAVDGKTMIDFGIYDLGLLTSIHDLWEPNQHLFASPVSPIGKFAPIRIDPNQPLEMFGCSRVANTILRQNANM